MYTGMTVLVWTLGIAVAVVFVYGGIAGWRVYERIQTSRELAADASAYEQSPANPTARMLVVGDSTGEGVGAAEPGGSVVGHLGSRWPGVSIENYARSGARLADAAAQLSTAEDGYDLILVLAGGNDVIFGTPVPEITQDADEVLTLARQKGARVVWLPAGNIGNLPVWPAPVAWYYARRSAEVYEIYERVAGQHEVTLVDVYRRAGQELFPPTDAYYAADGIHLTSAGYRVWADMIAEALPAKF